MEFLNKKAIATGMLVTMFGGLAHAMYGAIIDITKLKERDVAQERVLDRIENHLLRIDTKIDKIRDKI